MTAATRGSAKLVLAILVLVVVGGFLIAYLWETLNRLMAGHFEPTRLLISVPVLVVFAFLLRFITRAIDRWDGQPHV